MSEKKDKNGNGAAETSDTKTNEKITVNEKATPKMAEKKKAGTAGKKTKPDKENEKPIPEIADDAGETSDNPESGQPDTGNSSIESDPTPAKETDYSERSGSETFDFIGTDSTAFIDVAFTYSDEDAEEEIDETTEWLNKTEKTDKLRENERSELIQTGIYLIDDLADEVNLLINRTGKTVADKAIVMGGICWRLKKLNIGSDIPWGAWADTNLPFLGKRNRQKYMKIASRPDCHEFTPLGVDKMEVLCSLTKAPKNANENPIRELFDKYEIPYDEDSTLSMNEFKQKVDAAIKNERLLKSGVEIPFEIVTNAINAGIDLNKGQINRLKEIKECGGNPEISLQNMISRQGDDDPEETAEKRIQDFNSLSARLSRTVAYIIQDLDEMEKLDRDIFEVLMSKLEELKKAFPAEPGDVTEE